MVQISVKLLLGAIEHLHAERLVLTFHGQRNPVVIRPAGGGLDRAVVMPVVGGGQE